MENNGTVGRQTYIGLFLVTLSTLMFEILLTRIFSVTMWYHFAFMAISIAMFGMTGGAIIVYLLPDFFSPEKIKERLSLSAMLFAVSMVLSFWIHLQIPFDINFSLKSLIPITMTYIVIAIPFVFSGICVSLALTKFPSHIGRLYTADLAGAAVGCILLKFVLDVVDGPSAVLVVASLAGLGALYFIMETSLLRRRLWIGALSLALFAFSGANAYLHDQGVPFLRIKWVKGNREPSLLYEKWNSFSRIAVRKRAIVKPFGWGLSSSYKPQKNFPQMHMDIDAGASTVITQFPKDIQRLDFLKYDITNLVHFIRSNARILIIGTGGGRDVLSALLFNQKSVLGVEINKDIINIVNRKFGDYTGHLDRNPKVTFINDEARSYITRSKESFDIIQVSLIDTFAATAAGAFVLSENSLYTVEAWKIFLSHLSTDGVLTFSRWYFQDKPVEMYRLTSLATRSLLEMGITDTRRHIIVVRNMKRMGPDAVGVGTMLISRSPFLESDVRTIEEVARRMKFEVVLTPENALDINYATISGGINLDQFISGYPLKISAPTDDNPFFFNMLRLRDAFKSNMWWVGKGSFNQKAIFILFMLLLVVCLLTFLCIIVPLLLTRHKVNLRGSLAYFIFFSAIGFGFMFIEISQMQRLNIFLGHPSYSLTVTLFSLLLSSSMGSFFTQNLDAQKLREAGLFRLSLLLGALVIFGLLTPSVIVFFRSSYGHVRILAAVFILFFLGFFMGMAFPLGMRAASRRSVLLTPWMWGINGATSVCASVVATIIAINWGISSSFWVGFCCYAVAFLSFARATRTT